MNLLLVIWGGGIGTGGRYLLGSWLPLTLRVRVPLWNLHGQYLRLTDRRGKPACFYYVCQTRYKKDRSAYFKDKHIPAVELEAQVWEAVSGILRDPEQLRADLSAMIELERNNLHSDPAKEI